MRIPLLIVASAIALGCAPKSEMTREEALAARQEVIAATTREYPGKTVDEVLVAAQQVLALADRDFRFTHAPNDLTGTRPWMIYAVLAVAAGTDVWGVNATPTTDGVKVSIQINNQIGGTIVPTATAGGDVTTATLPGNLSPGGDPVSYVMFFDRLSFMLDASPEWPNCEDADERYRQTGRAEGSAASLCGVTFNDKHPDLEMQRMRIAARHANTPQKRYLGQ